MGQSNFRTTSCPPPFLSLPWPPLPQFFRKLRKRAQAGQALVEFLMILAMVFFISLTVLKVTNNSISKIWTVMVNTIIAPAGTVSIR